MREKSNLPLILVAVVAAGLLLGGVCVCFGVVAYFMPAPATQTLPTRDEMRAKLMGKTPQEVIALIGKPFRSTFHPNDVPSLMVFNSLTINPVTNMPDSYLYVHFSEEGVVTSISF